jgi:hypothetical protein
MTGAADQSGLRATIVTLRWRPTPSVFDGRISLLKALEEQKRLRAFNVGSDNARAVIEDGIELLIRPNNMSIAYPNNSGQVNRIAPLLDVIFEAFNPRVTGISAKFRHLLPWAYAGDYDNARRVAAGRQLGALADKFGVTDMAVLFEGLLPNKALSYMAEYGIVDRAEAITRVTSNIGRLQSSEDADLGGVNWTGKIGKVSEISLYVESIWSFTGKIPSQVTMDWCMEFRDEATTEAGNFADRLLALVSATGHPTGQGGDQ